MNILIIESEKHGHNLYLYLSSLLKKFSKNNNLFLLTSNEVYYDKKFQKLKKNLKFRVIKKQFPKRPNSYKFYLNCYLEICLISVLLGLLFLYHH